MVQLVKSTHDASLLLVSSQSQERAVTVRWEAFSFSETKVLKAKLVINWRGRRIKRFFSKMSPECFWSNHINKFRDIFLGGVVHLFTSCLALSLQAEEGGIEPSKLRVCLMGLSQVLIQKDACIARFLLKATNMVCVSYRNAIHVFSRTQFCWQVGKSSLVSQCITSDYINTYDASLGALTNPSWDFLSRLPFPHCRRRVRREVGVGFPGRPRGWDHLHRPPKQRNVGELVQWCKKKLICSFVYDHWPTL